VMMMYRRHVVVVVVIYEPFSHRLSAEKECVAEPCAARNISSYLFVRA